jgi:tetratricopeptide (TPR) repeat protein
MIFLTDNDNESKIEIIKKRIEDESCNIYEKSQYMIVLGDLTKDIDWYHKSFLNITDRIPLIKLAEHFFNLKDYQKTICYIKTALEIRSEKTDEKLLWMLYFSYWYNNDYENSKKYFDLCFALNDIENQDTKYLNDYRYYYILPKISILGNVDIVDLIYPEDKLEIIYDKKEITGEYVILSENIISRSTIMIEYLNKLNNKNSQLLNTEDYLDFKVIYIK